MNELIGKIVCGYKIVTEVGEGGMGKVYLAESAFLTEYKQQVAIKTLTTFAATEKQAALLRDLFVREANIQVQFKHPHIVSVIQFAVEGDHHFLILEYMPGYQFRGRRLSNVADVIHYETGPIPHQRALRWFVQALEAMDYAHHFVYRWEGEERIGIVHRDIKPANLLLLDEKTIKVSDFGIVKVQQRQGAVTQKLTPGTSAYMSPEAILGPQNYGLSELDARSDIYSLGVTLFEMLAGRLPFAPDPGVNVDVSLRRKHVKEIPPPPSTIYPGVPAALDLVVLRALEKRPEHRYQTAAEFKEAILALDSTLGLGLGEERPTGTIDTQPLPSTARVLPSQSTQPGLGLSTASGRQYDPAATNIMGPSVETIAQGTLIPEKKSSKTLWLALGLIVILVAAGAGYWFWKQGQSAPAVSTATESPRPAPPKIPEGMVLVPGGSYLMGRDLTEELKNYEIEELGRKIKVFTYDYPAHEVQVKPFLIDQTEVANRLYAEFIKATNRPAPENWNGTEPPPNAENMPVTFVAYQDAADYCHWRGERDNGGQGYRLPTEEEWEYAARGADAGKPTGKINLYPWGEEWVAGRANTRESRLERPQNVDSNRAGASPFGLLNMSGNVFEWTATDFNHYPGSDQQTPREKDYQGTYQVVRGGSFDYVKEYAMTTTRVWARPTNKGPRLGFRCAADAPGQ